MKDERTGRKTSPGFADPQLPVRLGQAAQQSSVAARPSVAVREIASAVSPDPHAAAPAAPASNRPRSLRSRPLIEIDVVRERGRVPRPDPLQGCYEIWTQNTVYIVDARMRCVQVRDLSSGTAKADHPFLGARLVGGQTQEPAMEMSHPLPRPGSCAVFDMRRNNRRQFTRTSAVERIVLRVQIVTIVDGTEVPSWDDLVADDNE
jgi:hypothetical protein